MFGDGFSKNFPTLHLPEGFTLLKLFTPADGHSFIETRASEKLDVNIFENRFVWLLNTSE